MQSWTPEMWQAAVIGLVIGVILGYVLLRLTKGSVKKQVQTEAELKEVKTQLSDKQAQLKKLLSDGIYFVDFLPSELHWFDVVLVLVAALVLSLLASLYPASRAAKLQPAQVLSNH